MSAAYFPPALFSQRESTQNPQRRLSTQLKNSEIPDTGAATFPFRSNSISSEENRWDLYDNSTFAMEMRGKRTHRRKPSKPIIAPAAISTIKDGRTAAPSTRFNVSPNPPLSPASHSSSTVVPTTEVYPEDDDELEIILSSPGDSPMLSAAPQATRSARFGAKRKSRSYKCWTWTSFLCTFPVPNWILGLCGVTNRDEQKAWRQKVALFGLVLVVCTLYVVGLEFTSRMLCDVPRGISLEQVRANGYYIINGRVADLSTSFLGFRLSKFAGLDVSSVFPAFMQLARLPDTTSYQEKIINACIPLQKQPMADSWLALKVNDKGLSVDENRRLAKCPNPNNPEDTSVACLYTRSDRNEVKARIIGHLVQNPRDIAQNSIFDYTDSTQRAHVIINNYVYDVTDYLRFATTKVSSDGNTNISNPQSIQVSTESGAFLGEKVTDALLSHLGGDATKSFLEAAGDSASIVQSCLDRLFYRGITPAATNVFNGCETVSPVVYTVVGALFLILAARLALAAFRLPVRGHASSSDAQCIMLMRCFNEPVEMLRATIDALTRSEYDDARKLLFVVCDGTGGERSPTGDTPRALLDILSFSGHEPIARSYASIGDGAKRVNFAKVYSGFYEVGAHRVPYLLMVKVGNESERTLLHPGSRGKRDTLLFVLRFLDRVRRFTELGLYHPKHEGQTARMAPLEHDLLHASYDLLGIDIRMFQHLLVVDSGISVKSDCLARMAGRLSVDPSLAAVGGETQPCRALTSFWAALQVYQHHLSHHISPCCDTAFTGCMSSLYPGLAMYRLREEGGRPCVASFAVIRQLRGPPESKKTPLGRALFLLGEDVRISASILRAIPGSAIAFEPAAIGYFGLPMTARGLIRGAVRDLMVEWHRLLDLVVSSRKGPVDGDVPFKVKMVALVSMIARALRPGTVLYGYVLILNLFDMHMELTHTTTVPNIVVVLSIISIISLHLIYHISRCRPTYILYLVLHTVVGVPLFDVFLPLYAIWKSDMVEQSDSGPTTALAGGPSMPSGIRNHPCIDDVPEIHAHLAPKSCPKMTAEEYELATMDENYVLFGSADGTSIKDLFAKTHSRRSSGKSSLFDEETRMPMEPERALGLSSPMAMDFDGFTYGEREPRVTRVLSFASDANTPNPYGYNEAPPSFPDYYGNRARAFRTGDRPDLLPLSSAAGTFSAEWEGYLTSMTESFSHAYSANGPSVQGSTYPLSPPKSPRRCTEEESNLSGHSFGGSENPLMDQDLGFVEMADYSPDLRYDYRITRSATTTGGSRSTTSAQSDPFDDDDEETATGKVATFYQTSSLAMQSGQKLEIGQPIAPDAFPEVAPFSNDISNAEPPLSLSNRPITTPLTASHSHITIPRTTPPSARNNARTPSTARSGASYSHPVIHPKSSVRTSPFADERESARNEYLIPRQVSRENIREKIYLLLQDADLNTVTRREVKNYLSVQFGEDVEIFHDFVNQCIEEFTMAKLCLV